VLRREIVALFADHRSIQSRTAGACIVWETGSSLVLQNETIERVLLGLALVSPIGGYRGVFVFSELSAESASRTNTPKVLLRATPIFWRHLFNYVACTPIA
jgi:hypothetical protein